MRSPIAEKCEPVSSRIERKGIAATSVRDLRYIANCERMDGFLCRAILRGERSRYSEYSGSSLFGLRAFLRRETGSEINFVGAPRFRSFQLRKQMPIGKRAASAVRLLR